MAEMRVEDGNLRGIDVEGDGGIVRTYRADKHGVLDVDPADVSRIREQIPMAVVANRRVFGGGCDWKDGKRVWE